ncbi:hypothetical protein DH2020_038708 [Rehmannia glutinosa]|uniref:Uncharacterized protein n=1 Tax=Rehmannia glutinosa TaxID=99300 RepID=A0ABR0UXU4_REHGL
MDRSNSIAKKTDGDENLERENDDVKEESIERIFESKEVPPWQKQLTFRAFFVSFVLSILFTFIVMKLNLTTGIIPSLNVSAGLLGFFFVKTWTKFLEKSGILKQPFTRQENTVIQTCVVASSGIAFSGGFGSYLFGMSEVVAKQSTEAHNSLNIKNPSLSWMIGFLFVVSFLGLFSVVPLRKIMIIDFKLIYPSGTATAHLINSFHTPQGAKLANLHGLQGLHSYRHDPRDGLYNFFKVLGRTIFGLYHQLRDKNAQLVLPVGSESSPSTTTLSYDDQRRTQLFLKDQIPTWVAVVGYVTIAVVSAATLPHIFRPLKWYYIVIIYIFAPMLAFCNAYGCGLTDWSLASTYGKLAIFVIGAWAGANHGGVLAGLAACGVMMNIVSTASDLTQDFKTGYMTLASPRSMFVSQIIGTAMGCVISPCVFWLFYKAFHDLGVPGSQYSAPYALVYRNMAILGVEGFSALPQHCLTLCYVFFIAAIVINGIRDAVGPKWAKFIPLPMAMAIPFYLGAYFTIDMCVGSLILFIWEKIDKAKADAFDQRWLLD